MSKVTTRIPIIIALFNTYILRTNNYLQLVVVPLNGIRLGWITQNITDWNTKTIAWIKLYGFYSDPLTRTKDINKQVKVFIKSFRTFAKPLLNLVAASVNAITTDGTVFNVVLIRKNPTHPTTPIEETCNATYEMLGGGMCKGKCRTTTDSKRASLAAGADGVQVAYVIGNTDTKVPDPNVGTTKENFSKATFILNLGAVNSGKVLYIYVRWVNSKYPALAGPWSLIQIIPIM